MNKHIEWVNEIPYAMGIPDGYQITESGVLYTAPGKEEKRICGKVFVASTIKMDKQRLVRILGVDSTDGEWFECILPKSSLLPSYPNRTPHTLADMGLDIDARLVDELLKYLSAVRPEHIQIAHTTTGWKKINNTNGSIFALPSGDIGAEHVDSIFMPKHGGQFYRSMYAQGTLPEWQEFVERPCHGNPLTIFALGTAFAAPLLEAIGIGTIQFNLCGTTSGAKTTCLQIAASAWGNGADPSVEPELSLTRSWAATANALPVIAASYNHLLLPIDELGLLRDKDPDKLPYQIHTGSGKSALKVNGELRDTANSKLILLSAGEQSYSSLVEAVTGRQASGGVLNRMLDISVDSVGGIIRSHSGKEASDMVRALKSACSRYFGVAGPHFLKFLVERVDSAGYIEQLKQSQARIVRLLEVEHSDLHRASERVLERFAIVGTALCQAAEAGTISVTQEAADEAVKTAFRAWLDQVPVISDAERGLECIREYMLVNPHRFGDANDIRTKSGSKVGYRDVKSRRVYILTSKMADVCGRPNKNPVLQALADKGYLKLGEPKVPGSDLRRFDSKAPIHGGTSRAFVIEERFFDVDAEERTAELLSNLGKWEDKDINEI